MQDKKIELKIEGMSCNGCVENISKMMMDLGSIKNVEIDLDKKFGLISTKSNFDSNNFLKRFEGTKFAVKILNEQVVQKNSLFTKIKNLI
tara:strand:+ start:127 stop:396 length:270 start_codon:yes stop_codon:yes gene_type:complete